MADFATGKGGDWEMVALVSLWTETLLYGIYTTLFFQSMYVMIKGIEGRSLAAKIFTWTAAFMYLIATVHVSIGFHFVLRRYRVPEADTSWLSTPSWDYMAYTGLGVMMMWTFDCVMIYRCYIIWGKRWFIIVGPIINLFACIILSLLACMGTEHSPIVIKAFKPLMHVTAPVYILQNIMTTGLISFRLVRQHRSSRASGIQPSNSRLNLFHVVRIILESAAILTVLLLIATIFIATGSPNACILAGMSPPTIGISLTLISFRLHNLTARAREPRTTLFTVPPWITEGNPLDVEATQSVESENRLTTVGMKSRPGLAPVTRWMGLPWLLLQRNFGSTVAQQDLPVSNASPPRV